MAGFGQGIDKNYILKVGKGARVGRTAGMTGPNWEGGRPAGGVGRWADRDREFFSGGRGCVSLWMVVPRRSDTMNADFKLLKK